LVKHKKDGKGEKKRKKKEKADCAQEGQQQLFADCMWIQEDISSGSRTWLVGLTGRLHDIK